MKRVCIGQIATAHGVRGLVKINCFAADPHMLDSNGPLYISDTGGKTIDIKLKNPVSKYWIAEVKDISDRDEALKLRGTKLWIDRDRLPEIEDEDEFYIEDLVGLSAGDMDGNDVGIVTAIQNFGAGDLLEIKPPAGPRILLPFTKETVPHIDIDAKKITISSAADFSGT